MIMCRYDGIVCGLSSRLGRFFQTEILFDFFQQLLRSWKAVELSPCIPIPTYHRDGNVVVIIEIVG